MLLQCTECHLPYHTYEDVQEHYEMTHPELHRQNNRLHVRIVKRVLNRHQKTYRCHLCYMPFPHALLRDSHVELNECDPEDDSDCEHDDPHPCGPRSRRGSVDSILTKLSKLSRRRASSASHQAS
ncbi:hypothetical protein B0H15DRAFT_1024503 [Mycena belliarum]|uniref:C2H2-type domain-containing protein n=1 Tax=Mycena belliarum TaxID=1033014 RepID=A0AAD6TX35_9AGAR|nr:hypothetical protein B0H15DRAFT_1024503 [Mycena belliae]